MTGVKVISVEQAVAGPFCTRHLSDLGADVIKVERPGRGDFSRDYDDYVLGYSSYLFWLNRGKRSIALDLKTESGRNVLAALLRGADVLVCNLAPGSFDRIFTDTELVEINPRLIRCFISGYGTVGPFAKRKAYDMLVQGEAGTIAATGTPAQPAKPGVSLADLAGGVYALSAINAALLGRSESGSGQRIEISLFDVLLEWMSPMLLMQRHNEAASDPAGLHHATIVPYGPYCSSGGDQVLVAVQNEGQWQRLCELVLDDGSLARHPDTASNAARLRNRAMVEAIVERATARLTTAELLSRLENADVPYANLNQIADVLEHPQAAATGRWSEARAPDGQTAAVVTSPFSRSCEPIRDVPSVGQHTGEVLAQLDIAHSDRESVISRAGQASEDKTDAQ